jgi:hypothetical protein
MADLSAHFPFLLGQTVRRIDGTDRGMIIGVVFRPSECVIVRWADDITCEPTEELLEMSQAA